MITTKPAYFDTFRCLAGACPDSCCQEWAVVVDEASAARYAALDGELGDRLRASMRIEDGDTILALTQDGRCPMWRDDGLCRIQAQLGEEGLCHTCHQFPRLKHDYGDFVEWGLELSCPEAARLILSGDSSIVTTQQPGNCEPEYDRQAMSILCRSRQQILAFLEGTDYSVPEALTVLLLFGCAVQNELDGGSEAILDPAHDLALAKTLPLTPGGDLLEFYKGLEILTNRWRTRLDAPLGGQWSESHRALARYFVTRYWLQAVSDYDLVSRVKLAICSCLVVKILGGDTCQTAQLYSKEIENDADNVDAILDGAYGSPALTDANLLWLLRQ